MKNTLSHYTPIAAAIAGLFMLTACGKSADTTQTTTANPETTTEQTLLVDESRLSIYHGVDLTSDLSHLSDNQHKMLSLLIDASKIMDDLFWKQAFFEDRPAGGSAEGGVGGEGKPSTRVVGLTR